MEGVSRVGLSTGGSQFIAQDLEQAPPAPLHNIIERSEPEHGMALIERQNDKDRTYRVSYGELFAPMVKSIQEQEQGDRRSAPRSEGAGRRFQDQE
jgi:hypothetical protein